MIVGYLWIINIMAFCFYGMDKRYAQKGRWRISENTLLGIAFLGGSLGALLGMHIFHHKTKHWKFRVLVPVFLILHVVIIMVC